MAYIKPATQCEKTQAIATFWYDQCFIGRMNLLTSLFFSSTHHIASVPVGPLVFYSGFTRAFLNGETKSATELLRDITEAVDAISVGKKLTLVDGA